MQEKIGNPPRDHDFKWVGTNPIRPDGMDKVTGKARYGADFNLPGQLHGQVLRSPHAHARIKKIDTSKAEALAALVALPGIGRKTANVILGNAFDIPGMVVDTHVGRIARRLGWTRARDAVKIERDLCGLLPAARWTQAAHVLIFHGRQCCRAQTAWCSRCPVVDRCPQVGVERQK